MRPPKAEMRAALLLTGFILAPAMISAVWTPHDPTAIDVSRRLLPPGTEYWLGTDHLGRDVVSMLMSGARQSLLVALGAVALGAGVGVPLGLAGAALRGTTEAMVSRVGDVLFAFPALVMAILLTAVFGPGALVATLAIGIFNIPVFARITRGAALPLFQMDFVRAARAVGKPRLRIAWDHILPNTAGLLIVQLTIQLSLALLAEAGLSYVGLGTQPPLPSLGRMLAETQTLIHIAPWLAVYPGLVVFTAVFGINLLGDALSDAIAARDTGHVPSSDETLPVQTAFERLEARTDG